MNPFEELQTEVNLRLMVAAMLPNDCPNCHWRERYLTPAPDLDMLRHMYGTHGQAQAESIVVKLGRSLFPNPQRAHQWTIDWLDLDLLHRVTSLRDRAERG